MLLRSATDEVNIVRGRDEVLRLSRSLAALCDRSGQPAALENLEYHFSLPAFRNRRPTMVIIESRTPRGRYPAAAVLVYEHQVMGIGSGIFASDFHGGARAIIAPRRLRARAAFAAAETLLASGGLLARLSYEGDDSADQLAPLAGQTNRWASRSRCGTYYLPILPDPEATLNQFGRRTRRNFRHYRRLVETELGATLVTLPALTLEQFVAFDAVCDYPVPAALAHSRFRKLQHFPQPLFFGLQAAGGEWLSLIGGYFHGPDAVIEWQLNRRDRHKYSLCTALRAFFFQYASEQQLRRIYFVGGTNHSMGSALIPEPVVDIVVARAGLPRRLINRVATATADLPAYQGIIPELIRDHSPPAPPISAAVTSELNSA